VNDDLVILKELVGHEDLAAHRTPERVPPQHHSGSKKGRLFGLFRRHVDTFVDSRRFFEMTLFEVRRQMFDALKVESAEVTLEDNVAVQAEVIGKC
jgi:hypothetical protein